MTAVRPYAQQSDEITDSRLGVVEFANFVGAHELSDGQAGAAAHFALDVGVALPSVKVTTGVRRLSREPS